jgi:hypothetical protein
MKWMIALTALAATPAFAHIEPGTYKGVTNGGKECSMVAGEQYFENNKPHPLNERIRVTVGETTFVVRHPPVIRSEESLVFFNHDLFQGLEPTDTGARALEIEMVHSAELEGPRSFTWMENSWKEGRRESYRCNGIKLEK